MVSQIDAPYIIVDASVTKYNTNISVPLYLMPIYFLDYAMPAYTILYGEALPKGGLVEIEAIANVGVQTAGRIFQLK